MIKAFRLLKKTWTITNMKFHFEEKFGQAITTACDEIINGQLNNQFPLSISETVSGTQLNVNVNEVIFDRAIEILGGAIRSKTPVHPTNHANKNQSPDHVFSGQKK